MNTDQKKQRAAEQRRYQRKRERRMHPCQDCGNVLTMGVRCRSCAGIVRWQDRQLRQRMTKTNGSLQQAATMKRCQRCGRVLPRSEQHFYRDRSGTYHGPCKACRGAPLVPREERMSRVQNSDLLRRIRRRDNDQLALLQVVEEGADTHDLVAVEVAALILQALEA